MGQETPKFDYLRNTLNFNEWSLYCPLILYVTVLPLTKVGRIRGGGIAQGCELGLSSLPHWVAQLVFTGGDPVQVALQGVDLA